MRTIALALGTVAAVFVGATVARFDAELFAAAAGLACGLAALAWLVAASSTRDRRPQAAAATLVLTLIAVGWLRGGSAPPAGDGWGHGRTHGRVAERGWTDEPASGALRVFEVVGASMPGPRCQLQLRAPGARGPALTVAARPEACPRSAGDRVALLAQDLVPSWERELYPQRRIVDLPHNAPLWGRSRTAPPTLIQRYWQDHWQRYWRWVAERRQLAWTHSRDDPRAQLAVATALGLRSALAPPLRERLRAAGIGHLIAVSGLHVAVAALWLQAGLRRVATLLGIPARLGGGFGWAPLLAYVALTGAPASAVRAAVMLIAIDLAALTGRPQHGPTLLAVTAAAMLLARPGWLVDPGFQLSLAAMAAIVTTPARPEQPAAAPSSALLLSWRITWATAPLSLLHFGRAPLHGLVGNALALPAFALLMPAALVGVLLLGRLGSAALAPARLLAAPVLDLAELLAAWPAAGPATLALAAGVALVLHGWLARRRAASDWPRIRAWLPPPLAAAAAVLVGFTLGVTSASAPVLPASRRFDWLARGTVHSRALLVADERRPTHACLYRPTGSPRSWALLLEALAVRGLGRLDADLPRREPGANPAPRSDPGTRELAERLRQAGVDIDAGGSCEPPPAELVRAALRACRFRHGNRGPSLVRRRPAGTIECRMQGSWVAMPELSAELVPDPVPDPVPDLPLPLPATDDGPPHPR